MKLNASLAFLSHPLSRGHRLEALVRYVRWQVGSRLVPGPVAVEFAGKARLLVRPGMTGATGNIYCGLSDFTEMAFVVHALRPDDLFVDVGANVGTYTILAAAVAGSRVIAFEPVPETFQSLRDNLLLNDLTERVQAFNIGIGSCDGTLEFLVAHDTMNRVATENDSSTNGNTISVPIKRLTDALASAKGPTIIKIDVEGFETEVVRGAAELLLNWKEPLAIIMETNGSGRHYGFDDDVLHREMVEKYGFGVFTYNPMQRELLLVHDTTAMEQRANTLYVKTPSFFVERVRAAEPINVNGIAI